MIGPKGKFMLQPDDERTHVFISSGTGNAPFVAMMRQLLIDGRPREVVFLNGVSYASELGYRDVLEGWVTSGEYPVTYVPTVSRPMDPRNADWPGRTGRVEMILGGVLDELDLGPGNSVAYICGNPDMILSAEVDAPRARLRRGPGPQGAVLAQGQGAAGRRRRRSRRRDRGRRGERRPVARSLAALVRRRVVRPQEVLAPVVRRVAPDRVDVVGPILRVVVLDQQARAADGVVVALTRDVRARPRRR